MIMPIPQMKPKLVRSALRVTAVVKKRALASVQQGHIQRPVPQSVKFVQTGRFQQVELASVKNVQREHLENSECHVYLVLIIRIQLQELPLVKHVQKERKQIQIIQNV